ncbi:MAG: oligopeptide ABC transporter, substrate-binding protein OppA [Ktedonobacterales bacterium]|jgi:peptide/nickel transport system substrate-binding protein/oligopeptide transport system substrate-binding protein|nr:MAG: oligopeptide ABC transporter, substrate-binding protein OppA [Ktedonobacterales bacterium]
MVGLHPVRQNASSNSRRNTRPVGIISRVLITLAGLAALLLTACAGQGGGQAPLAANQVFTWPYVPPPIGATSILDGQDFDPAIAQYANDSGTIGMLYAGLVSYDSNLNVVGDAALKWEVSNNGTTYTFHLRPNLKFSDGSPLTAADYAYSIDRALDPALCTSELGDSQTYAVKPSPDTALCYGTVIDPANPNSGPVYVVNYLNHILGANARISGQGGSDHSLVGTGNDTQHGLVVVDPQTLVIRLDSPVAYFLEALTYPISYPVEKSLVEKYKGGTWVYHLDEGGCSGPFKVKSYGNGQNLQLVPNTYWEQAWGKQLKLSEVDRPFEASVDNSYADYRSGKYDFTSVPGKAYSFARGQEDFNEVPTLQTDYFQVNWSQPPFNNLKVRQAFDLALNKQYLVDSIYNGGEVPTNHIVPRGMPGFNATLVNPPPDGTQSLTGNQSAAQTLMKQVVTDCKAQEAQQAQQPPTNPPTTSVAPECAFVDSGAQSQPISFWVGPTNQTRVDLMNAAVAQWNQVLGLNVHAKVQSNKCVNDINNVCQGWIIGWVADYPDPQDFLSLQFRSANSGHVQNNDMNKLFDAADVDQSANRMQDYYKAEQMAVDNVAWIPYGQAKLFWRQRTWVHGFGLNPLYLVVDTAWVNVYITQH